MKYSRIADGVLISAGPAVLLQALIFDMLVRAMSAQAGDSLAQSVRIAFLIPMLELLLMVAVLGLIWMLVSARGYGWLVSAVFLVLGVLVLYAFPLLAVLPFPESWYALVIYAGSDTFVFQAGGALAALGLISLFFWKNPEVEEEEAATAASEE